jgi:hypothetical protein
MNEKLFCFFLLMVSFLQADYFRTNISLHPFSTLKENKEFLLEIEIDKIFTSSSQCQNLCHPTLKCILEKRATVFLGSKESDGVLIETYLTTKNHHLQLFVSILIKKDDQIIYGHDCTIEHKLRE